MEKTGYGRFRKVNTLSVRQIKRGQEADMLVSVGVKKEERQASVSVA